MLTTAPRTALRATAPVSWRGVAAIFAFGAVFGSLFDGFHTYSGSTAYPSPVALRMAWWTPPLFGAAFTLLGLGYGIGRRRGDPLPDARRLAFAFVFFGALYFSSGFLPASNAVRAGVLLAGAGVLFAVVDRGRAALISACSAALLGPAFEVFLVHVGGFAHLRPDFLGIPVWLPALYFAAGAGAAPLAYAILSGEIARDARRAAAD